MILIHAINAEKMKLKRSSVWLAFIGIPIIPAIMGTFNYLGNIDILQNEWYSLWSQNTLFTCYFFLPALIGIFCSYLCHLEHMNHNWNAVMTAPMPISILFFAKFFWASIMVVLTMAFIGTLYIISGKLVGLTSAIPTDLPIWLLCGIFGGIVICAIQLLLSLMIRSFAIPVGIALIGGIIALVTASKGWGAYFPYALASLGMRANNPEGPMACSGTQFFINCIVFVLIFGVTAISWIKYRDVIS